MTPQKRAQSIRRRLRSIDSHWIWLGARNSQGQPVIRVDGEIISLARYFWEAYFKRPAVGRLVRYRCRMKLCVRPTHYRESIRIPAAIARNQTALDLYLAPLRQS